MYNTYIYNSIYYLNDDSLRLRRSMHPFAERIDNWPTLSTPLSPTRRSVIVLDVRTPIGTRVCACACDTLVIRNPVR